MLNAFQPQGNTVLIAATTAPSAGVQPSTGNIQGARIANVGASVAFIAIGSSNVSASVPTTALPSTSNGIPILPNTAEVFTIPPNGYISAATTSGAASVYVTPGFGV